MSSSTHADTIGAAFTGVVVVEDAAFSNDLVDDVLKFSAATAKVRGLVTSIGGHENSCDINNTSSVFVGGHLVLSGGDQSSLLVKGGSRLETGTCGGVTITPSPKSKTDVLVDDWSDQSQEPSTVSGDIRRADGRPVRVVFGRWRRPKITGPSKVVWSWTIGLHLYNPLKALVRLILRIPKGTKGPSWL